MAARRNRPPRHAANVPSNWRSFFAVEPRRWATKRSFIFDEDLGRALEGGFVAIVGLGFTVSGVVEVVTRGIWNPLLLIGGPALFLVGAFLAFIAWVERSGPPFTKRTQDDLRPRTRRG